MSRHVIVIGFNVLCFILGGNQNMADEPTAAEPDSIRVAAVQISGYDKGELPRVDLSPRQRWFPTLIAPVEIGRT